MESIRVTTEAALRGDCAALTEAVRRTPLHVLMGLRVVDAGPPIVMTMELSDDVRGPVAGSVHGGILGAFADTTSALALRQLLEPSQLQVTTDIHLRYYRQPRGGPLRAVAEVVHHGRRLLGTECSITDNEGRVLVRSTATYMVVPLEERLK